MKVRQSEKASKETRFWKCIIVKDLEKKNLKYDQRRRSRNSLTRKEYSRLRSWTDYQEKKLVPRPIKFLERCVFKVSRMLSKKSKI